MKIPFKEFVEREIVSDAVLIACGLPATNKTETTEVVARLKGYEMLRTDVIRREVLKGEDIFDEKIASNMDKRTLVYDTMFSREVLWLKKMRRLQLMARLLKPFPEHNFG